MLNWCCSQPLTNRTFSGCCFFWRFLLQLLPFFGGIFIKFFSDNRGCVLPPILIVVYKVKKNRAISIFISTQFLAQHKEMSRYCTRMETAFAQLNCLVLLFSYGCSLRLPVHWNVCIKVKSNGFGAFMCKYSEAIYLVLWWDLLNRFPHFALWNNSCGTTCSLFRNVLNAARIPPRGLSSPLAQGLPLCCCFGSDVAAIWLVKTY